MTRTQEQIQTDLEAEREQLAASVEQLRDSLKLRPKLHTLAAGAASVGFVLGGGVGATLRYLTRRGRGRH
jgi:hypothetical protein